MFSRSHWNAKFQSAFLNSFSFNGAFFKSLFLWPINVDTVDLTTELKLLAVFSKLISLSQCGRCLIDSHYPELVKITCLFPYDVYKELPLPPLRCPRRRLLRQSRRNRSSNWRRLRQRKRSCIDSVSQEDVTHLAKWNSTQYTESTIIQFSFLNFWKW